MITARDILSLSLGNVERRRYQGEKDKLRKRIVGNDNVVTFKYYHHFKKVFTIDIELKNKGFRYEWEWYGTLKGSLKEIEKQLKSTPLPVTIKKTILHAIRKHDWNSVKKQGWFYHPGYGVFTYEIETPIVHVLIREGENFYSAE